MILPRTTNPKFTRWVAEQTNAIRSAIIEKWDALKDHPEISQGHPNADYARLTFLIEFCRDTYGYSP